MTVAELKKLLRDTPGLRDDAQVVTWDAAKGAWQSTLMDVSSVSGVSPWSSLLLGCAESFQQASGEAPDAP